MDTQEQHSACTALKELQTQVSDREKVVDENLVQLQTQILNATTETTLGQQALQLKLDTQATNLATEVSERQASQQLLQANISGVQTAIQTEVSNRQEAITGIRSELTTLQTSVPLTVQAAIDNLVAGAPKALDTLKEISTWIESHDGETGIVANLNAAIAQAEANAKNLANATGTLAIAKGGTGATTAKEAQFNLLKDMEDLTNEGTNTEFVDTTPVICAYANDTGDGTVGTKSLGTIYRRNCSKLWDYIKDKISSILGLTASRYNGNSKNTFSVVESSEGTNSGIRFFQRSGDATVMPSAAWTSLIRCQHGVDDYGYYQDLAFAFDTDEIKYRRCYNKSLKDWRTVAFTDSTVANATSATQDGSGNNIVNTYATKTALNNKVDKESGKGLSTNDFTTAYKSKLDSITIV